MYKQHQIEVHVETVNIEEEDVVELVPKQDDVVELIPIDDFKDWNVLSSANEELTMNENNNGDLIMEYTYKRTVVIRSQVLKDLLKTNTVKRAMQALEFKNDNDNLKRLVRQLVYNIHCQKDEPYFHSIRNTDISRGTVKIYNRESDSEKCVWNFHRPKYAVNILNNHARNLTSFLLQAGINMMESKLWFSKKCVVMFVPDDEYPLVIYFDNDEQCIKVLRGKGFVIDDLTKCPENLSSESARLRTLVDERKNDIVLQLEQVSMDENQWKQFYDFSRPIVLHTPVTTTIKSK